jgi:hypothetical protein
MLKHVSMGLQVVIFGLGLGVAACGVDLEGNQADRERSNDSAADLSASSEALAAPAFTGGGCTGEFPISACISGSGSSVLADFYMNRVPDVTSFWYVVEVTRSNGGQGSWFSRQAKRLDHTGHYNAEGAPVMTDPPSHGCATTIVHVYDNNFNPHFSSTPSPRVCY